MFKNKTNPVTEARSEVKRMEKALMEAEGVRSTAAAAVGMDPRLIYDLQPLTGNEDSMLAQHGITPEARRGLENRVAFYDADKACTLARKNLRAAEEALNEAEKAERLANLGDGRAALAQAINAHNDAVEANAGARRTVEKARGSLVAAQTRHSTTESTLAEARERAIGAMTGDAAQAPEMKTLRRDVADAADDVEIAAEALRRAEDAMSEPDYVERKTREAIETAADTVLALQFDKALAVAQDHAAKFVRSAWLAHSFGRATPGFAGEGHRRCQSVEVMNPHMVVQNDKGRELRERAHAEFAAARAALLSDPSAPLPAL